MYHRDFLIRMLQQFVVLMARLAGLKSKDDPEVVIAETDAGLKQFTGLNPEIIANLSTDSLVTLLSARDPDDHTTLAMMLLLLKSQGQAYLNVNAEIQGRSRLRKAIELLDRIDLDKLPSELRQYMNVRADLEAILDAADFKTLE
ncbi:MAG: hypothetical protein K8S54_20005 [Spirochaetia bacterium]|nr:hypothetical protein [Spirochaetia bacterium]